MSSMWSSCLRSSPAIASASWGSKLAISIVVRNMQGLCAAAVRSLCQILDDGAPGLGEIGAIVATSAERQHPAMSESLGKLRQLACGTAVRCGREAHMGDRVAVDAVRTALQKNELGRESLEVLNHFRPDTGEDRVIRTRGHGNVELGSGRLTATGLGGGARTGIKSVPILVNVGEHHARIVLESVEHAVAVMGVDVDIADPRQATVATHVLDHDTAVVEDAKSRGAVARCMVQSCDGNEGAARVTGDDGIHRAHGRADDSRRG